MFGSIRQRLTAFSPRTIDDADISTAAVGIILSPGRDCPLDILFIKRAERTGDPWSGQMALPGGRREPRDCSLLETACRETFEETGIRIDDGDCLGQLDDLHPVAPQLPPIVVRPFVFGVAPRPAVRPSDEVALHLWASTETLVRSQRSAEVNVRDSRMDVEAFVVGPHVIWGMTHRIIKPFLDLVNTE